MVGNDDGLAFDKISCKNFENCSDVKSFFSETNNPGLKIIHFNIRSYFKNLDSTLVTLQTTGVKFDCIALSETWVDDSKTPTNLDGYDMFSTTDNWNRNDGSIIYLKSDLCGTAHNIKLGQATGLQVDFIINGQNYYLMTAYRSPTMNCDLFMNDLERYCETIKISKKSTYVFMGDTNIDILTNSINEKDKDRYLDILYSAGFIECINLPTRETDHSKTCLDHIFIKHFDCNAIRSGVMKTDVTDHYAIMANVGLEFSNDDFTRNNEYTDPDIMNQLIRAQPWDHVLALQQVNQCCEEFLNTFISIKSQATRPKNQTHASKN